MILSSHPDLRINFSNQQYSQRMQSIFPTYFQLGLEHITDLKGYDHILFIITLCAVYRLSEWRKVLILVTAFTIGHSLTLALAALDVVKVKPELIEFAIALTIFITALYNVLRRQEAEAQQVWFSRRLNVNYLFALAFGLIHGMGFSNFFRAMLMPGEEGQLMTQLLAFNLGVEAGQLCIVAVVLLLSWLAFNLLRIPQRDWTLFISGAGAGLSLVMMLERM